MLKQFLLFIILFVSFIEYSFSCSYHNNLESLVFKDSIKDESESVYVCLGNHAYTYHSNYNCGGLGNCKAQITNVSPQYAIYNLNRVPCCRCFSAPNCKDDNTTQSSYSGGNGSGGAGALILPLAAIVVASGAIILSNDVAIYGGYRFNKWRKDMGNIKIINSWGGTLGFRKTFTHSSLEYGISYVRYKYQRSYYGYNEPISTRDQFGGYFAYIHDIFYNRLPEKINVYVGPIIHAVYKVGYGATLGIRYKLLDRLRLDFRYELTSQTNQLQLGLIINYQKEYFWKKKR